MMMAPMMPVLGPVPAGTVPQKIGIIHPPTEIKNIIDKTAQFVARLGKDFETRIHSNEQNNPKFSFLKPADPFHAYYKNKVRESMIEHGITPPAETTTNQQDQKKEEKKESHLSQISSSLIRLLIYRHSMSTLSS